MNSTSFQNLVCQIITGKYMCVTIKTQNQVDFGVDQQIPEGKSHADNELRTYSIDVT
jgi:hypothetical protein